VENLVGLLPLLACPLGMGLMMWMMMGMNKRQDMGSTAAENAPGGGATGGANPDDRLAQLRAQLGEVQAQQATIAAKIAELSAEDRSAEPGEAARTAPSEPARPAARKRGRGA
jgi:hypothetical protein